MDVSVKDQENRLQQELALLSLRGLSASTVIAMVIALLVLAFSVTDITNLASMIWFPATIIAVIARSIILFRLRKEINLEGIEAKSATVIYRQAWFFGLSDGLIWSSASWFVYSYNLAEHYLVVSMMLATLTIYGLAYVFQLKAALIAAGLTIAPSLFFISAQLNNDGYQHVVIVAAFCILAAFFVKELRHYILGNLQAIIQQKIISEQHELAVQTERDANFIFNQQWSNTPLAAIEWDRTFKILRWNPSAASIFGYTEEEAVGKSLDIIFFDKDIKRMKQKWRKAWLGHKSQRSILACHDSENNVIHCEWHDSALSKDGAAIGITSFVEDVSSQVRSDEIIKNQADFDNLTGLPNRRQMMRKLDDALERSRDSKDFCALIFLDLDHFKDINDTQGHDVGDLVLKAFGNKLEPLIRHSDTASRFGGDEFVILLENLGRTRDGAIKNAQSVADKLLKVGENLCKIGDINYDLDVSGGIALFNGNVANASEILKSADLAMYQVKQNGRKGICFYDDSLSLEAEYRVEVLRSLRSSLKNDELELYSQPIVDLQGNSLYYENLLRWQRGDNKIVPAAEFIDILSNSPMIMPVGYWIFETVCKNINELRRQGLWNEEGAFFVNVSPKQLVDSAFTNRVKSILEENDIDPRWVVIEITEESLIKSYDDVVKKLHELVDHGLRIALDDFGTGYSSLALLKDLPIQFLKLDKEFIRCLEDNTDNNLIVEAIIKLCDIMALKVIAEGVETEAQFKILKAMDCDYIQGYYATKPMAFNRLCEYLEPDQNELDQNQRTGNIYQFDRSSI